ADEALYLAKQGGRDRVAGADRPSAIGLVAPLPPLRTVPTRPESQALPVGAPPALPM
ncbi:MAG: GGDEF domain-containing protein, partial [Acidobacteria bacterium]|nr:GGDEF domain-containing protein [Acidobacteriota bacterium]